MRDHDCEAFLGEEGVSEPLIYVGDDLPYTVSEDLDDVDRPTWADNFAHSKKHFVQEATRCSPRLRHGFLLDTPNPMYTSLPLYSSDAGSPRCHTPRQTVMHSLLPRTANTLHPPMTSAVTRILSSPLWDTQFSWLALYFSFNLLLTLSNKSVLTVFPFPYTLTALHALFSTLGGTWLRWQGAYTSKRLTRRNECVLAGFSFLYAINIAVSNLSLNLVTVPFHQVIRAVTPVFTILLSAVFFNTHFRRGKMVPLTPVIVGVALATYGDYYFTAWGFCLTLFGTFLAALKTIFTNVLQTTPKTKLAPGVPPADLSEYLAKSGLDNTLIGTLTSTIQSLLPPSLELHPLDLLTRMSPLAFVQCVVYAQISGELEKVRQFSAGSSSASIQAMGPTRVSILLINGCIAFGLNVVSFFANGKVGPLSMTVAANVKQVLTILFAVSLFNLTITPTNALGITLTLLGGAWYAWEEYYMKTRKSRRTIAS